MKRFLTLMLGLCIATSLSACGDHDHHHGNHDHDHAHGEGHDHDHDHDHGHGGEHGEPHDLGSLELSGTAYRVTQLGIIETGKEAAFEVRADGLDTAELGKRQVFVWLENEDGEQVSANARAELEGDHLHVHAVARKDATHVVVRWRQDGIDARGRLALSQGK